jgi:5-methylcytosine-specific restriction endonuclease McrA
MQFSDFNNQLSVTIFKIIVTMQKHIKVYFNHYGLDEHSFIACEVCKAKAVDIHHIVFRSKFGKKTKDQQDAIENLIALCRECHNKAHDNKLTKEWLLELHTSNL